MIYGYVRISSKNQIEDRQIKSLKLAGVSSDNIYVDKESGKNFDRTSWKTLMAKLVVGDVIIIKELDRMGRNNKELKKNFELVQKKGCYLEILENPLLSTRNKSKLEIELIQPLILHLLGYFAEKEREKILIRQKEAYASLTVDKKGRKISKRTNRVIGRPNKIENLSTEQKRYIRAWIDGSIKISDCIKNTKLSKSSLFRIKKNQIF
ncbi:MAG: recombinase family protein [Fusobacterium sp.]|nr:recombinase family protein [Fusobacterium sp.]